MSIHAVYVCAMNKCNLKVFLYEICPSLTLSLTHHIRTGVEFSFSGVVLALRNLNFVAFQTFR